MTEHKVLNSRVLLKNDLAAEWAKVPDFIPLEGEIIIYNYDNGTAPKFKIGNGSTKISVLPFFNNLEELNYALSNTPGGAAISAEKLTTDAGSATQPIYFSNGIPVATTYTLEASVPSDAKFTDTTYNVATQYTNGLMSSADKKKLNTYPDTYTAPETYVLPAATTSSMGGIIVGENLSIDASGVLSADAQEYGEATSSQAGLMSIKDKIKLNGIAEGAEVNQNAFTSITDGKVTIAADAKQDVLNFTAGEGISIVLDAVRDNITISSALEAISNSKIDEIIGSKLVVENPLVDEVTGTTYRLYVSDAKLKMEGI